MTHRALVVLARAGGIVAGLAVLLVAGALLIAVFVAVVNSTSGPPETPDTGLTPEEVGGELGRDAGEDLRRMHCEEARDAGVDVDC